MKLSKIFSVFIIAICLCCFLVACGNDIDKALQGRWSTSVKASEGGAALERTFIQFKNGKVESAASLFGGGTLTNKGTYTIEERYIVIEYENGTEIPIPYEYKDGELTLDGLTKD